MKSTSAAVVASYPMVSPNNTTGPVLGHNERQWFLLIKRGVDLSFAIVAFPIFAALTVLIFMINFWFNPGTVFFRQTRMGQDGRPFTMWKFRTMTSNGASLRAANAPLDAHRITPFGRLLRRTKMDELPNILNILSGDMSLVGPRPDAFEHATEYLARVPRYRNRLHVRPGITGLAQVRGGYADDTRSVRRKARYDGFYIQNSSLLLDMYVILLTFGVVLSGFGQR